MKNDLLEEFKNPGCEYRGAPFWAWNGKLDPDELRRQIRLMKGMGLGGFFMHSRIGLDTAYLSDEWFDCISACVDEAEKQDMQAWLYDEDRWPSGAAGGLVTKNPKYRGRYLAIRMLKPGTPVRRTPDTVAVYVARVDGTIARDIRLIPAGKTPAAAPDEVILRCDIELFQLDDNFNGLTYLDTLNPEAVREFIRVTHEAYRKRFGGKFGKHFPGVFTDEPDHGRTLYEVTGEDPAIRITWTGRLPAEFRKRYGYDLIPHLLEVAFDVEGILPSQARYHFHDCLVQMFVEAFSHQISAWCERHGAMFTGHLMMEDTLYSQAHRVGSCMRFYETMQAPGMDMLMENGRVFATAKQVTSVAHQFGQKWRLTETYGCTGWDFPFAGHKALGDWQAAMGITLRCQHLSWYTMEGEAKRDFPASIFYQSPWWNLYGKVEDYYARINATMTRGTEVRDLLVIHPVESVWFVTRRIQRSNPARTRIDLAFLETTDLLLGNHLDFDYGDEEILSRHARVVKKGSRVELRVGKAAYRAVLVPAQITMRRTTLALLKRFRAAGGTVVFAGQQATHVDALPSSEVTQFASEGLSLAAPGAELVMALEPIARRLSITDAGGKEITAALYLLREDKENFYLFVCNTGEDFLAAPKPATLPDFTPGPTFMSKVRDRRLAFPDVRIRGFEGAAGQPVELNPETGASLAASAVKTTSGWEIRTSLPVHGSRLYMVPKRAAKVLSVPAPVLRTVRTETLGLEQWTVQCSEANVLVLDRCAFKIGTGDWQPVTEILRVDNAVRKSMGLAERGGSMVQPWARKMPAKPRTTPLSLSYEFTVEARPSGDLYLAIERPGLFEISLNGNPVSVESECGWWTDRSLSKLRVDPADLKSGVNVLRVETTYSEVFAGLEIIYFLGNFGVRVNGTGVAITAPATTLAIGDWCEQGLPFYSGHVAYVRTIQPVRSSGERVFVCVPEYRGIGVRVLVDGQPAGVIGWEPNELEITPLLGGKAVELAIEVLGHRRNSHGPFHLDTKWPPWTGPDEFKYQENHWFEGYQLVPCGLMAPPRIEVRRD